MIEITKDDILKRMYDLDEEAFATFDVTGRLTVVIVGGSALILLNYLPRATDDVDVLRLDSELSELIVKYDMNTRVSAYMDNFALNYEDRLVHVWSGLLIDFYTASLEDIVIAKLCAARPDDWDDLEFVADKVNWDILEQLAKDDGELKSSILNDRRYKDFLYDYENYVRRFCPCGN
jgi:hypothetical protein